MPWLPAEARVADRFVRALLAGRYASAREAVPDCRQALERLRARSPGNGKNLPRRSLRAVWCRISGQARGAGKPLRRVRYTREEKQLFARYARQLASGRYATIADAARACWTAHARLRQRPSPPPARPLYGIYQTLDVASRKLGRKPAPRLQWTPDSERILRRYALAVAAGRYPNASAAVPDCRRELLLPHSTDSTSRRLRRLAGEAGWSPAAKRWSYAENRIAEPFARAVVRGEYPGVSAAIGDCLTALKAAGMHGRSGMDVKCKLRRLTRKLGLKPRHTRWSASELEVVDRFARRLVEGDFRSTKTATGPCLQALVEAGYGRHTPEGIRHKINIAARTLGCPRGWPLWTEAENRACDSWIVWYERHRRVRRYQPSTQAIDGLHEDILNLGNERPRRACQAHFLIRRRQSRGLT